MAVQGIEEAKRFKDARKLFFATGRRITDPYTVDRLWKRHLNPLEREKLGGTIYRALENHGNVVCMWMSLYHVSYQRAVIEIGEALGFLTATDADYLLREGGELPRDPEEAQSEAITRGDLVIERSTMSAFWNGELIDVEWGDNKEAWDFFVKACEHAQCEEPIDCLSFGKEARNNIVTQKKSRLKAVPGFPFELIKLFRKAGTGTQRFTVPPDQVHIF